VSQLWIDSRIVTAGAARSGSATRVREAAIVVLFCATALLGCALLMGFEPMFARMVLPRLGGSSAAWTGCMALFQVSVLAGYLYAHLAPRYLGLRRHAVAHMAVLLLPLPFLPVALTAAGGEVAAGPMLSLLGVFVTCAAVPFLVVSTTAPLMQRWFLATGHRAGEDPYFLFAVSNAGGLIALVAYPLWIEPALRPSLAQAWVWTSLYVVFYALVAACAGVMRARVPEDAPSEATTRLDAPPIPRSLRLRWVALAFVPSSYLLGVTSFTSGDIAAVPLLFLAPLGVYLLTFVIGFSRRPLIRQEFACRLWPSMVLGIALLMAAHVAQPTWLIPALHLLAFFFGALGCHGELARLRPSRTRLTEFYVMLALGGALGGLFNAVAAPVIFCEAYEYPLMLVLVGLLLPTFAPPMPRRGVMAQVVLPIFVGGVAFGGPLVLQRLTVGWPLLIVPVLAVGVLAAMLVREHRLSFAATLVMLLASGSTANPDRNGRILGARRSFLGVHRVVRDEGNRFTDLYQGTALTMIRDRQSLAAPDEPLTYYHRTGPVGDVMRLLPHRRAAIVGLGAGSLAAYAEHGDEFTFLEMDEAACVLADRHFTFLTAARERGVKIDIVLGEARLTLGDLPDHSLDMLVLDAFGDGGGGVPTHLLTREAAQIYLRKLKAGGVIAMHVSNIHMDLRAVAAALAADRRCACLTRCDMDVAPSEMAAGKLPSQWVVLAPSRAALQRLEQSGRWRAVPSHSRAWTDEYSDVLGAVRWGR
jgi:hypothetical protein